MMTFKILSFGLLLQIFSQTPELLPSSNPPIEQTSLEVSAQNSNLRSVRLADFEIVGRLPDAELRNIGESAADLKSDLIRYWLSDRDTQRWDSPCKLVVHRTRKEYLAAVGRNALQTTGTTSIQLQAGKVILRRIDLLQTEDGKVPTALRHELLHVLLADLFPRNAPPRWAEEGLALMNDSEEKQLAHLMELEAAGDSVSASTAGDVVLSSTYPELERRGLFYAKSLAVVSLLVEREGPSEFIRFLDLCCKSGAESALATVYGIRTVEELQSIYEESRRTVRQVGFRTIRK